jgi:ferritin
MCEKLNQQIEVEFFSSNLYLQMSSWCSARGLNGSAAFLLRHAEEERMHMMKLFTYVNETGVMAIVPALEKPDHEFEGLNDLFTKILDHEKFVTSKINELVEAAMAEKDYSTFNFLQWYVAEQHEEEALFSGILDRINLIGVDGKGMFLIDNEIASAGVVPA